MLQCGARWDAQSITKLNQDQVACFIDCHPALHVDLMHVDHRQDLHTEAWLAH
jgi:hypothetical protein